MSEIFDKYYYYTKSVQSAENDVEFFNDFYKETRKTEAITFREDFCGGFLICCEWVKLGDKKKAIGLDLDQEPIEYGFKNYLSKLNQDQKKRVSIFEQNVLKSDLPKADMVAALNFSYFIFKERQVLKTYFQNVYDSLNENGLFFLDCFGGPATQERNEEEVEHEGFSYFWDQDYYNPINNDAKFYIHFKIDGEKRKRERVFSYDWRMWSLPELKDLMTEVGFKDVKVLWEGSDEEGDGNGVFTESKEGEECESWIAYVVGCK